MTTVREMLLHIGVLDEAMKRIEDIKQAGQALEKEGISVPVAAQDKASNALRSVSTQLSGLKSEAATTTPTLGAIGNSLALLGRNAETIQNSIGRTGGAIQNLSRSFQTLGTAGVQALQSISRGWGEVEDGIKKVTAIAGGLALGSAYSAMGVQANLDIIQSQRPADLPAWKRFVDRGDEIEYTSAIQRSNLAAGVARYWKGADQKLSQEVLEILEKQAVREGLSPGDIAEVVKGVGLGRDKALKSMLPGMDIDYESIDKEVERRMASPIWRQQNADKSESEVRVDVVMEKIKEWGERPQADFGGVSVKDMKVSLDYMNQIKKEVQDISTVLGKNLLPYVELFIKGLQKASELMQQFPKATSILALGAGFVFVAGTISIMLASFLGLLGQLKVGATVMFVASKAAQGFGLAMKGLSLAMYLVSAHPIIAALILIGGLLAIVAIKTGFAQKAFDALMNSRPAKFISDLLSGKTDFKIAMDFLGRMMFPVAVAQVLLKYLPEVWKVLSSGATIQEKIQGLTGLLVDVVRDILKFFKPVVDIFTIIKTQLMNFGAWVSEFWAWIKQTMAQLPEQIGQKVKFWDKGADRTEAETGAAASVPVGNYVQGPNESKITPEQWAAMYALRGPDFAQTQVYGPDGQIGQTVGDLMPFSEALKALYAMRLQGQTVKSIPGVSLGARGQTIDELAQTRPWLAPILDGGEQAQVLGAQHEAEANKRLDEAGTWGGWSVPGVSKLGEGLAHLGKSLWGGVKAVGSARSSMAAGGQILSSGGLIGHGGEEVAPAEVVVGGETVLEKLVRTIGSPATAPILGGGGVTINGPLIHVERVERSADIEDVMWRARRQIENMQKRQIGHYQT